MRASFPRAPAPRFDRYSGSSAALYSPSWRATSSASASVTAEKQLVGHWAGHWAGQNREQLGVGTTRRLLVIMPLGGSIRICDREYGQRSVSARLCRMDHCRYRHHLGGHRGVRSALRRRFVDGGASIYTMGLLCSDSCSLVAVCDLQVYARTLIFTNACSRVNASVCFEYV